MKHADIKAMMAEVAPVIREFTASALAPLMARLDALEKSMSELPTPQDGKDADPDAIAAAVMEKMAGELAEVCAAVEAIPAAPELPDISGMIAEAVAAIPEPLGEDAVKQMIEGAFAALPPPPEPVDPAPYKPAADEIRQWAADIAEIIELPTPQDGKGVTVEELRPLVEESVAKAVSGLPMPRDGQPGKDGVGVAGAIIDRFGNLTLTLTDGTTRDLGLIVGKDAEPGKPGNDGLGFDDMTEELADDGRTIVRRYSRGDQVKEFRHTFPVLLDRGVFKEGQEYQKGDGVTWAGSFWIAQDGTSEKPEGGKGWRLAVKRGRDGRDGTMKPDSGPPKVKV